MNTIRSFSITVLTICFYQVSSAIADQNVLFIIADDLNCAISPYGDPIAQTPNLERIAARGLTFVRTYCQQAVCNPSRSSFLTVLRPDTVTVDDLRKSFRGYCFQQRSLRRTTTDVQSSGYRSSQSFPTLPIATGRSPILPLPC